MKTFTFIALAAVTVFTVASWGVLGKSSGSASATIAAQILQNFDFSWPRIVSLVMSALVAGLTVGGKAIGKTFAINSCTQIISVVGKVIYTFRNFRGIFQKKEKK